MAPKPRCTAQAKSTGETCTRPAVDGLDKCRFHCGMSLDAAKEKGRMNLVAENVAEFLRDQGYQPLGDPVEELLDLTARMKGWMEFLTARVGELESWRYESKAGGEQLRAEVALLERAADRFGKLLEKCVSLGLLERQVSNQERVADGLLDFMDRVFADPELGLSDEQRGTARDVVLRLAAA